MKFTKQKWVSELVSESVSDKGEQWSDSGPIIKGFVSNSELDSKHKVFTKNWNMFTNYIDISNSTILGAEPVFKR